MTRADIALLRASLVLVWLLTAFASAWEAGDRSAALLHQAGVHRPAIVAAMLWGGVALDMVVGLMLWRAPLRTAATIALVATLAMTVIASAVLPVLWLDPLGSLSKNLPLLAALRVFRRHAE